MRNRIVYPQAGRELFLHFFKGVISGKRLTGLFKAIAYPKMRFYAIQAFRIILSGCKKLGTAIHFFFMYSYLAQLRMF